MKKIAILVAAALMSVVALAKDPELKIPYNQLPEQAQQFLTQYFAANPVKNTTQKFDDGVAEYKAYLKGGIIVEFDMLGGWDEVWLTRGGNMPRMILPDVVQETLDSRFGDKRIYKMENNGYEYKVKFTDRTEVEINVNGQITEFEYD